MFYIFIYVYMYVYIVARKLVFFSTLESTFLSNIEKILTLISYDRVSIHLHIEHTHMIWIFIFFNIYITLTKNSAVD